MNIFQALEKRLNKPQQILIFCCAFIFLNVVLDGTIFHIRKLYLNKKYLTAKTTEISIKNQTLLDKLDQLSDPVHLEKEVRNRFDLAGQGDLIFIFPEDE